MEGCVSSQATSCTGHENCLNVHGSKQWRWNTQPQRPKTRLHEVRGAAPSAAAAHTHDVHRCTSGDLQMAQVPLAAAEDARLMAVSGMAIGRPIRSEEAERSTPRGSAAASFLMAAGDTSARSRLPVIRAAESRR